VTTSGAPPPGWFPDPSGAPAWRWWDGAEWTGYASSPQTAGHDAVPYGVWHEGTAAPLARVAVLAYAAGGALACLSSVLYFGVLRAELHYMRVVFDSVSQARGVTPVPPVQPHGYSVLTTVTLVLVVAAEIVFLTWQHRAAKVGRDLGYPARISPGWGVACWFVPVANLVLPYQAIRDTLPPGHPARPRFLRTWLGLVAAVLLTLITSVAGAFTRPAGIVLAVLTVAAWAFYGVTMRRTVGEITTEHRLAAEWLQRA